MKKNKKKRKVLENVKKRVKGKEEEGLLKKGKKKEVKKVKKKKWSKKNEELIKSISDEKEMKENVDRGGKI